MIHTNSKATHIIIQNNNRNKQHTLLVINASNHKTAHMGRNVSIPRSKWHIMPKTPIQQDPQTKQPQTTYSYPLVLVIIMAFSTSQIKRL